jgi:hypothetical protein
MSRAKNAHRKPCLHCALPLPAFEKSAFCCRGCEAVYGLLSNGGLARYYELGGGDGHPVSQGTSDHKWLEPIATRLASQPGLTRLVLDVQGLHCSACVWLFEEIFRREPASAGIVVSARVVRRDHRGARLPVRPLAEGRRRSCELRPRLAHGRVHRDRD